MKTVQLTKEGLENLTKEVNELREIKRPATVDRLQKARAMGDLSENSEYTAAKEELAFVEGRIQELEILIANAEVVEVHAANGSVEIGCKVIVEKDGKTEEYVIVGEFEANPMERKLSSTSPIGQALMNKKIGETVKVEVPAGVLTYKIKDVKKG